MAHALEFGDLLRDPLLEFLVPLRKLNGLGFETRGLL